MNLYLLQMWGYEKVMQFKALQAFYLKKKTTCFECPNPNNLIRDAFAVY